MTPPRQSEGRVAATEADLYAFNRACNELRALAAKGLHVYLANDTLCLMSGNSHDEQHRPLRDNVIISHIIPGASGGDW